MRGTSFWVYLPVAGRENKVDTPSLEGGEVGFQCARVGAQVLMRRKLHGVDENRCDHGIGMMVSLLNQCQVARMQIAHSRYECDFLGMSVEAGKALPKISDIRCDDHDANSGVGVLFSGVLAGLYCVNKRFECRLN